MAGRRTMLLPPLLFLAAGAPGKEKPLPPRAPVFSSEVSLVSIPVFVSDRAGKAVRGLALPDFELYEDGRKVEVVAFQYVDTTSPEDQAQIKLAPPARRRFLFLFDLSFTDPGGLHRSQVAARDFVRRKLAESDLAAVATFDTNRGLRVVANFTEDRSLLGKAIETLGAPALARITDPLSLTLAATDIPGAGGGVEGSGLVFGEGAGVMAALAGRLRQADENIYRSQVQGLIGSLEELGRALRGVEGRKQVLYFSAGFDSRALVGATASEMRTSNDAVAQGRIWEVDSNARYGDSRLRDSFGAMTKVLASADCVVHAVDVSGLGDGSRLTETQTAKESIRSTPGRDSLFTLSSETGGRLFKDTNDLATILDEVQHMTARFYILGYQPERPKGPGKFHKPPRAA